MLCEYGCNKEAQVQLKNKKWCCSTSSNKCSEVRRKNSENLKKAYKENKGLSNHKTFSEEARLRMGASNRGKNKSNCEHIMRKSKSTQKNYSNGKWVASFTGKNHSPETLEKMRNAALRIIEEQCLNGLPVVPAIGKNESCCLDEIEKIINEKVDRQVRLRGYFLDGLLRSKKIALEFDEPFHDKDINIERDSERQKYLEEKENLKFFRIKESDWVVDRQDILEKFKLFYDQISI